MRVKNYTTHEGYEAQLAMTVNQGTWVMIYVWTALWWLCEFSHPSLKLQRALEEGIE